MICSWHTKCSTAWASQLDNAAGIYMLLGASEREQMQVVDYIAVKGL